VQCGGAQQRGNGAYDARNAVQTTHKNLKILFKIRYLKKNFLPQMNAD
jgi:hypothetical protein